MEPADAGATARSTDGQPRGVERAGRRIGYWVQGTGRPVLLLASAGREASDFNELASALTGAGFRTIAIDAPGINASDLPDSTQTLFDLADDVRAVADAEHGPSDPPPVVIGHAFGNRLARAFATRHADRVAAVVLIAAGGRRPTPEAAHRALVACFDPSLAADMRLDHIRYGFFADGNPVPEHWRRGWHGETATLQGAATRTTPSDAWWSAGGRPMLVVQAEADRIAPREDSGDALLADYPERVEMAVIIDAGHAMLPEQPDAIARAILDYLARLP